MFSQKWGKAPPLRSGCLRKCNLIFWASPVQSLKITVLNLSVLAGMALILHGCSFDSFGPVKGHWYAEAYRLMPREVSPVTVFLSMDSSSTKLGRGNEGTASDPVQNNNKDSAGSQRPRQKEGQKPAILVPETPNKDNGPMINSYKSIVEKTQNLIRTIDEGQLTKEQHDTYLSINSFLEKSREAFDQDDLPMAMNLAEKAHTLVKEIANNSVIP